MEGGTPIGSPLKSNCSDEAPATLGDGAKGSQQLGGEDRGLVIGGDRPCVRNGACHPFPWRSAVGSPEEDKGESGRTVSSV